MTIKALRTEAPVTAKNLRSLNLIYLINAVAEKPRPRHGKASISEKEDVNTARKPEADPHLLLNASST